MTHSSHVTLLFIREQLVGELVGEEHFLPPILYMQANTFLGVVVEGRKRGGGWGWFT
jgi:hypothetical protein